MLVKQRPEVKHIISSTATTAMAQCKGESSVWTDNGAGLLWTTTLEYKVYKIQENAI